jgi:hypothetical protein
MMCLPPQAAASGQHACGGPQSAASGHTGTFGGTRRHRQPRIAARAAVLMDLDKLVGHWTSLDHERETIAGQRARTPGFAPLRFYAGAGRFPARQAELDDALGTVAQLRLPSVTA